MKSNKKAQAALEHMSTYVWAFLIILLMVGALSYLGVLNPKKTIADTCVISVEFKCVDSGLTEDNVSIKIRNNLEQITIMNISIKDRDSDSSSYLTSSINLNGGQTHTFEFAKPDGANWNSGDKKKVDIIITYKSKSSSDEFKKTIGGEILGTVQ